MAYIAGDECAREYGLSFPRLYTEGSTHGRGGHGFPLLDKWDYYPESINDLLLHRLQPWLNRIAQERNFDIEFVEVKGTLPVVYWGEAKYEVLSYTAGSLGKLPREGEARFEELRNTSVITVRDLQRLPVAEKAFTKKEASAPKEHGESTAGSTSGRHVSDEMLAGLGEGGRYRAVADMLLGTHTLSTSGRQVATAEDVAITLMLGEWFTDHMLPNGALPEARWIGMWTSLHRCEDIDRAWCHKRFKAIRDWLSSLGLLDWQDKTYVVGWYDEDGVYHKGRAAKWRFSAELMEMLAPTEDDRGGHVADNHENEGKTKDNDCGAGLDNREEERHPLWEHVIQEWVESLVRQTDNETIRPVEQGRAVIHLFDPDEITRLIAPFEALAG